MTKLFLALSATFALTTSFYFTPDNHLVQAETQEVVSAQKETVKLISSAPKAEESLYNTIDFSNVERLNAEVFDKAVLGFENLKKAGKLPALSHILTVCDFSLSSNKKRLWIIDLDSKKVLYNTLVAHGKNTGEEFATNFSNTESSLQSSMGFYVTHGTYTGENGYSLKLEGLDNGYNDAAMQRAIVMHGADYVSQQFAAEHKRIGRSWGCPAVPRELAEPIINTVKDGNCLFIFFPDQHYLSESKWLKS